MLAFNSFLSFFFIHILWIHLTTCANRTIYSSIGQSPEDPIEGWRIDIHDDIKYEEGDEVRWTFDSNSNNPGPRYGACPGSPSTVVNRALERNWLLSNYYESEGDTIYFEIQCLTFATFPVPDCRDAFQIFILQSDNPINLNNSISQFSSIESTFLSGSTSIISANISLNKNGFYIGFLNQGMCVHLTSFLFYYNICPSTSEMYSVPETPVPRLSQQPTQVNIICPLGSLSRNRAECYSNSNWVLYPCECVAGWRQLSNLSCAACPVNSYKEFVGNERECVTCPSESSTDGNTGSVTCECGAGFYRGEGESVSMECGRSPSAVRNISVERYSVERTMLRVLWDEPVEVFNRSVSYNLSLYTRESDRDVLAWSGISVDLWYNLSESELEGSREYVLVVTPLNNLVELSGMENSENISFVSTFPLLKNFSLIGNNSIFEFVYELKGGVNELSFELNYTSNGDVMMQAAVNGCSLVSEDTYGCRVTVNNFDDNIEFVLILNTFSSIEVGDRISITRNLKSSETTQLPTSTFSSPTFFTTPIPPEPSPLLSMSTIFYLILASSVVALAIAVTVIILFFVLCCYFIKKPVRKLYSTIKDESRHLDIPFSPTYQEYTDPSLFGDFREAVRHFAKEVNIEDITISKVIGNGEFGDVCAGTLNQEGQLIAVALKTLKPNSSEKSKSDFFLEASTMGQFEHENIIPLFGVTLNAPIMIITPFMANLSMDKFLREKDRKLSVIQLGNLTLGVARGMVYLSSRSYIHRDLAARNILVDHDLTPKIADFGLSRVIEEDFYTMHRRGKVAIRWTALESILYYRFNTASDVWSFGILAWEIMSFGAMPYEGMDILNLVEKLEAGYRMSKPESCPQLMYQLMRECWQESAEKRPSFEEIQSNLQDMIESHFGARRYARLSKTFQDDPLSFSCVGDWLDSLNMSRYEDNFNENGFTSLNSVWSLNEQDLLRIGIIPLNHRNKIMTSIRKANRVLGRTFKECTTTRI